MPRLSLVQTVVQFFIAASIAATPMGYILRIDEGRTLEPG